MIFRAKFHTDDIRHTCGGKKRATLRTKRFISTRTKIERIFSGSKHSIFRGKSSSAVHHAIKILREQKLPRFSSYLSFVALAQFALKVTKNSQLHFCSVVNCGRLSIFKKPNAQADFSTIEIHVVLTRDRDSQDITKIEISIGTGLAEFAKRLTDRLTGPPNSLVQMRFLDPNRAQAWGQCPSRTREYLFYRTKIYFIKFLERIARIYVLW